MAGVTPSPVWLTSLAVPVARSTTKRSSLVPPSRCPGTTLGEERRSRPIARNLKQQAAEGRLETTGDLRRAVHRGFGGLCGFIQALSLEIFRGFESLLGAFEKSFGRRIFLFPLFASFLARRFRNRLLLFLKGGEEFFA